MPFHFPNKADQQLGFPKGKTQEIESPLTTALREWDEETSLPQDRILCVDGLALLDKWRCHYFIADWIGGEPFTAGGCPNRFT